MARWEPNAVGRLVEASLQLFREPGYDKVTVAEIAALAGVTPRTFFRYFPDKREVLFASSANLEALVTEGVANAPSGATVLDVVAAALAPITRFSDDDPSHATFARQRHVVIQAHAELRERELGKHAALAAALATALRARGVSELAAKLAAEAGLVAFTIGFQRWADDPQHRTMSAHVHEAMRELGSVLSGSVIVDPPPEE